MHAWILFGLGCDLANVDAKGVANAASGGDSAPAVHPVVIDTAEDTFGAAGPSYEAAVWPILNETCQGCHSSPDIGLSFAEASSYDLLVGRPSDELPSMARVEAGSLDRSYLWHKLGGTQLDIGGDGTMMPPPYHYGSLPLSDDGRQTIGLWIASGASP